MGKAGQSFRQRGEGLGIARHRMAECDSNAGGGERRDEALRHLLRCQGHQGHAGARLGQKSQIRRRRRPDHCRIVDPRPLPRQKRSLEMNPENPRHRSDRGFRGGTRGTHLLHSVADQGRQQRRRAEAAMRGDDRGDPLHGRRVVEQDVAAAIDLDIDKAGRQPGTVRQPADRQRARQVTRQDQGADPAAFDDDGVVTVQDRAIEHRIGGDRVRSGAFHRVRVTFCRWRGRSGSMPSRSARRTIIA